MITVDSTIHLSDLLLLGGGLIALWRAFLADRDVKRDMVVLLASHGRRLTLVEERTETHHEWLLRHGFNEPLRRVDDEAP